MSTEDALRDALLGLADLAPDPARVRRRMTGRIKAHKQRRALLLTGAAAAGTAAVGVPVVLWLSRNRTPVDGNLPTPAVEPTNPGNLRVPMRLRPTWLPEGVNEVAREALIGGPNQMREWLSPAAAAAYQQGNQEKASGELAVTLRIIHPEAPAWPTELPPVPGTPTPPTAPPFYPLGAPPNARIGGRDAVIAGLYDHPINQSLVAWFIDDAGTVASVFVPRVPDAVAIAERVARSTVPDSFGGVETALKFGWLPLREAGTSVFGVSVIGFGDGVIQNLSVDPDGGGRSFARLATTEKLLFQDTQNFTEALVRGLPGKVSANEDSAYAVVGLSNGQWLLVNAVTSGSAGDHQTAALRVANELLIGPDPYVGWVGRR